MNSYTFPPAYPYTYPPTFPPHAYTTSSAAPALYAMPPYYTYIPHHPYVWPQYAPHPVLIPYYVWAPLPALPQSSPTPGLYHAPDYAARQMPPLPRAQEPEPSSAIPAAGFAVNTVAGSLRDEDVLKALHAAGRENNRSRRALHAKRVLAKMPPIPKAERGPQKVDRISLRHTLLRYKCQLELNERSRELDLPEVFDARLVTVKDGVNRTFTRPGYTTFVRSNLHQEIKPKKKRRKNVKKRPVIPRGSFRCHTV
ncbi:hypothetical protein K466DRAFT_561494 [Polyporus arcularius HHB13444]|uniref:Uncharacterized protein n=1 Tax=Polyporus arcularius HHB13444 TaxID=1314778 RepID=A0A5C3PVF6_9APHY|nr:hypothetical protein K466DRAFT_561494 [Polyporus arcularius HHB13444]